jgi:hypothetical protein
VIEKRFDIPFLANLALREKQIQQNYRPVIAVHKWFARRPGTLFRGLLLSEFGSGDLQESFYQPSSLNGITVADPFMGGGTPIIEANRLGCNVIGCDINPMSYWIVERELASLDLDEYQSISDSFLTGLKKQLESFYLTTCATCGNEVPVKYFLWVKTQQCQVCGDEFDLFPGYLLATNNRHPSYVIICSSCGQLNEVGDHLNPGACCQCHTPLRVQGPAKGNKCACSHCGSNNQYPQPTQGPPQHRMAAIEYYCPHCKPNHQGRFFKKPDEADQLRYEQAAAMLSISKKSYIPDDIIPPGDETTRLHRWGYNQYSELFNHRQQLGLVLSCDVIAALPDGEVKNALATNLSDLLRYQNMLCRYDTRALKSLDIFSIHGFPVGLMQCESNLLGIVDEKRGVNVGSGGWTNIIDKYRRAKDYCQHPFEIHHVNGKKIQVPIPGEWIGTGKDNHDQQQDRTIQLHCGSSTDLSLPPNSLDAVFTDPPYFGNVQYAELMDFCYVWLRRLMGSSVPGFERQTTRDIDELTGNTTMDRGVAHFLCGISKVLCNMAQALKPGSPLVFTYHHNDIGAYYPIAAAILDAGLICTASIPCPGEMGGSIHINGTGSSITDTVFVCRSTGVVSRRTIVDTAEAIAELVLQDLKSLKTGGIKYSQGDIRCIAFGHLIRLSVWFLRADWNVNWDAMTKIERIAAQARRLGEWADIKDYVLNVTAVPERQSWIALEPEMSYEGEDYEIAF